MLIRLESSFIDTVSQLNANFSEKEKQQLASNIESKYNDLISIIKDLEQKKVKSEQKIIEIGNIGTRVFALSIYYSSETETGDIPLSITQLIPTISPVRIDIMSKLQQQQQSNNTNATYLKAGQVYDDGDIHVKYVKEVLEEDEGLRPIE
jgi:acetate kinase